MRYTYLLISLAILLCQTLLAQPINKYIDDVAIPTPNEAALGKYIDVPVSYYTGVPSISVPIHTAVQGPLSSSVSIDYHASGIRLDEISSRVGLGWRLNAGGSITRVVNGLRDDDAGAGVKGYYHYGQDLTPISDPVLDELNMGFRDGEPDIFSFSCGGYSGQFYFKANQEVVLVPVQDVQVELINDPVTNYFDGFLVITPDGNRHHFGIFDQEEAYTITHPDFDFTTNNEYISTWHLLRTENHDRTHHISYSYEDDLYTYTTTATCRYLIASCGTSGSAGVTCSGLQLQNGQATYNFNNLHIEGKRLSQINTETETIDFISGTDRQDLSDYEISSGQTDKKELDAIEISTGSFCKTYLLDQHYVEDANFNNLNVDPPAKRRLILDKITEESCSGDIAIPPYTFTYNSPETLPWRHSKAIDHWGYYNGKTNNDFNLLNIPPSSLGPGSSAGASDRDTDENFMKRGVLTSITYPTGGVTTLDLEANRYTTDQIQESQIFERTNCVTPTPTCCGNPHEINFSRTFNNSELSDPKIEMLLNVLTQGGFCQPPVSSAQIEVKFTRQGTNSNDFSESFSIMTNVSPYQDRMEYPLSNLIAGVVYDISIKIYNGWGTVRMFSQELVRADRHVGGLRIKQKTEHDGISDANDIITDYNYLDESLPTTESSGVLLYEPLYARSLTGLEGPLTGGMLNNTQVELYTTSSIVPISNFDNNHIGYKSVQVSQPGNGRTIYNYLSDNKSNTVIHEYPVEPLDYVASNGQLQEELTFLEGSNTTVADRDIDRHFKTFFDSHNEYNMIRVSETFSCGLQGSNGFFFWNDYNIPTQAYLVGTTAQTLDNVEVITDMNYDNQERFVAPVSSTMTNSDGQKYHSQYIYPHDVSGSAYVEMVDRNIITPVETILSVGPNISTATQIGGNRTVYELFNYNGEDHPKAKFYDDREVTWINHVTYQDLGYVRQATINAYDNATGYPTSMRLRGWDHDHLMTWNTNGTPKTRSFDQYQTQYTYESGTRLLDKITNIDGTTESFDWDNLFRLKSATDVNGVNTLLDYHYGTGTSLNFVKHSINYPNLGGTQQTIVNVSYVDGLYRNKQLKQFDQSPEQSGESILTEWSYDNFGRVFESFEPLSSLTSENSYTASSQTELTATSFEPSPLNRVSSSTPPDWHATQSTYGSNDAGEVINQTTGQPYAPNTLFKTSTIDPIGQVIEVFADKRGNQVLNRVKESNTSTSNAEIADTYTLYDLKDRPIITLPPQTDMSDTDLIFKKFYSGDDLVLTKDDPDCDPVDFVYDDRDLLRYRQDGERRAENKWYAIEYDDYGQIIKEGFAPTTTAAIDDILITNTWSESGIETGKMLSCTKALLEVDSDLEITETYEYDQVGRLKTTRYNSVLHPQAASIVETLTYDDQNNILEATQDLTLDDITIMYSYDYDNVGRPERTSIEVTTPPATTGGSMQVFSQELCEMSYNAKELLSQLELGDGLQDIDYTYLPNRLLENINGSAGVQLSNGDLWSQSLVYFDDQNIKRTVWRDAIIANLRSYTYDYDFLKRLTVSSFNQTGETDAYNTTYTYKDHRGNLQALNRRSEGNIIDDLEYGYIDGTNQIESITDGAPSALKSQGFKSIGTTDYSYDDNGAMLYDQGRSIDFNYNHLNLPYKIEVPDSNGMIMYYYTGDGTLHRQEEIRDDIIYQIRDYIGGVEFVNGRLEQIKHDHGYVNLDQGLTEHHLQLTGTEPSNETYNTITTVSDRIVPDPIVTEYISEQMIILTPGFEVNFGADFHADIDVFPIQGLEYRYFIKDHLGSVRVEFEDDGTGTAVPTNVTNYYPFGLPWESDTDTRNNWTYTGQELQRSFDLGVMNYGARFYDPSIGRMMSVDPLADEISNLPWATYAYGWNNPINVIDPTGAFNEYVQITDSDGNVTTQKVSDAGGDQIDFVHHATDNGDGTLEIESTDVIEVVTAVSEGTEVHQRSPGFNILPGANPAAQATGSPVEAVPLLATNSARALVGGIMKGLVNLFKGKGGAKEGSSGGPGAGKRFSDKTKNLAEQEARSRCVFCNQKTVRKPGPNQRNTDHAIPKSRGGNNTLKNAQNTCRTCNLKKGTKTTREFLNQKVGQ